MDSRILVALDDLSSTDARCLAKELRGHVAGFKVNDLLDECGVEICESLGQYGEVMADPKLFDIPNTMKNRARRYANCTYLTVHAGNSGKALVAARDAVPSSCRILAVTILTSMDEIDCGSLYFDGGYTAEGRALPDALVERKVLDFAKNAQLAGLRGLVCSAKELEVLRPHAMNMKFVVPGVRSNGADTHDQVRVMTPAEAVHRGAYRVVIGREIVNSSDPVKTAMGINNDVSAFATA